MDTRGRRQARRMIDASAVPCPRRCGQRWTRCCLLFSLSIPFKGSPYGAPVYVGTSDWLCGWLSDRMGRGFGGLGPECIASLATGEDGSGVHVALCLLLAVPPSASHLGFAKLLGHIEGSEDCVVCVLVFVCLFVCFFTLGLSPLGLLIAKQTEWLVNNRNSFFIVLEAGSPRSGWQHGQIL